VVTGGSPALVLAVDYALRPVLTSLGAAHVGQGWFVLGDHVRLFPDGGVLLDPAASGPLYEVTDAFLRHLDATSARRLTVAAASSSEEQIRVRAVQIGDPALRPLLADLVVEYGTRYGRPSANTELTEVPITDFEAPNGAFLVLTQGTETIAGGALRRKDDRTAEVKRVWTAHPHRRRGLARRVIAELERTAAELGYSQVYLTTGPRQPEARNLYLAAGYAPQFDLTADPESIGPLPFTKTLAAVPLQRVGGRAELAGARR
jgi:GNAT superfamily N-acetyltransferase